MNCLCWRTDFRKSASRFQVGSKSLATAEQNKTSHRTLASNRENLTFVSGSLPLSKSSLINDNRTFEASYENASHSA